VYIFEKENDTQSSVIMINGTKVCSLWIFENEKRNMGKKEPQNRFKQKFFRFSTKNEGRNHRYFSPSNILLLVFLSLGSMLKIFGDELNPSISCQTLLLSNKDTAEWIVKQMLFGYGLKHENPQNYCLIQVESNGFVLIFE